MTPLFHQSFVRVRAPLVTDRYGNRKRDWSSADRLTVEGVNIQPASRLPSNEESDDRLTVVTGWDLQTPEGMDLDLLATDRVEFDGMTLEVEGNVGRWPDPFGPGVHHVEARLKEVD
jgi:hypothetical protein